MPTQEALADYSSSTGGGAPGGGARPPSLPSSWPCTLATSANCLGFEHAASFMAFFKRHIGLAPLRYRQQPLLHAQALGRPFLRIARTTATAYLPA